MHIVIEKNGEKQDEISLDNGPAYIGRQIGSKVFLPDLGVSRQHAVLFNVNKDEWYIEDLESSNKTYVNGEEVTKCRLVSGDTVTVCDFKLSVRIEKDKQRSPSVHLDDTIAHAQYELKTITRKLSNADSPLVRISHQRVEMIRNGLTDIIAINSIEELLDYCCKQMIRNMNAAHAWIGVFESGMSSVLYGCGRNMDTTKLNYDSVPLKDQITAAVTQNEHILVPQIVQPLGQNKNLRSAIITPFNLKGNKSGAAYVDNTRKNEHFTIVDLDYLMIVTTMLAAKIDSLL